MTASRRVVAVVLAVGLLAGAPGAAAQVPGKVYRVGFIGIAPLTGPNTPLIAFRNTLRQRGWIEGQNLSLELRFHEGRLEQIPAIVDDFVRRQLDVIVTVSDAVTGLAAQATRTIPIVMATGGDPVKLGVAQSLARPGGNVTGLINYASTEVFGTYLQLLKETRPQTRRIVILWDVHPAYPHLAEMPRAAQALGMEVRVQPVNNRTELEAALTRLTSERPDAIFVMAGAVNWSERERIVDWTLKERIPSISDAAPFARAGLLIGYSTDFTDQFRRTAEFVDKILRGARPGDLPIEQPTKFQLIVNRRTATALGVTIPPSVLLRADDVID